jgi:mono/diheme cytochrome c family protein
VLPDDPASLIRIVLAGGRMPVTGDDPYRAFAMPGFAKLSDAEVADVVTFIRASWGNNAPPVSAGEVASARKSTAAITPARP